MNRFSSLPSSLSLFNSSQLMTGSGFEQLVDISLTLCTPLALFSCLMTIRVLMYFSRSERYSSIVLSLMFMLSSQSSLFFGSSLNLDLESSSRVSLRMGLTFSTRSFRSRTLCSFLARQFSSSALFFSSSVIFFSISFFFSLSLLASSIFLSNSLFSSSRPSMFLDSSSMQLYSEQFCSSDLMKVLVISSRVWMPLFSLMSLKAYSIIFMCFLYCSIIFSFSLLEETIFLSLCLRRGWVSMDSGLLFFSNLRVQRSRLSFMYSFSKVSNCLMYWSRSIQFLDLISMISSFSSSALFFLRSMRMSFSWVSVSYLPICSSRLVSISVQFRFSLLSMSMSFLSLLLWATVSLQVEMALSRFASRFLTLAWSMTLWALLFSFLSSFSLPFSFSQSSVMFLRESWMLKNFRFSCYSLRVQLSTQRWRVYSWVQVGSTEARVLLTELLVLKPVYIRIGLVLFIFYR